MQMQVVDVKLNQINQITAKQHHIEDSVLNATNCARLLHERFANIVKNSSSC
jgi:hypothetical protein